MDAIAIVLYNFTAKTKEQISVKVGDKVRVAAYSPNWLNATLLSNSIKKENYVNGIIPKNFIKIIQNITADNSIINDSAISVINSSKISSADNIKEISKLSIHKPSIQIEYSHICMIVCVILFIVVILTNFSLLIFVKKKLNEKKILNKRFYRRNNFDNSVEEKKIWDWDYYELNSFMF